MSDPISAFGTKTDVAEFMRTRPSFPVLLAGWVFRALFQRTWMTIFFRRIVWTHELQYCQSKSLLRQALFDEPQLNVAQTGSEEALITVNVALVGTQTSSSFVHKRHSRHTILESPLR
jgi:hypothetical protein